MATVLIVDDVLPLAQQYAYDLNRLLGVETVVAGGGDEALERLEDTLVDCVLLDLEMPGRDGFDVLATLSERGIDVPVIVYTGTGDFDRCVRAVKLGADGFIDKNEAMERVAREVEAAVERRRLRREVRRLENRLGDDSPLIGKSPAMEQLRTAIDRLAPIPSPVLVLGESGTGKELVARELHRRSPRRSGPFLALNAAAFPETLVESELFGHEAGAFTGAGRPRRGAFETASGGTLFLDEIGELPAPVQAKLLRVLENGELLRLGSSKPLTTKTRVVAATHRDLDADVEAGRFRRDLLYRINVHTVRVPPLRERSEDLPVLIEHFLAICAKHLGVPSKTIEPEAVRRLSDHPWRGNNVRELRNVVERVLLSVPGTRITAADVSPDIGGGALGDLTGRRAPLKELKAEAERRLVLTALERNRWRIGETAAELGLADHASLLKIMRRHGIKRP